MNEIDRRAFFASLLGAAVTAGVAAKIPGLVEALPDGPITVAIDPLRIIGPVRIGDVIRARKIEGGWEVYEIVAIDPR